MPLCLASWVPSDMVYLVIPSGSTIACWVAPLVTEPHTSHAPDLRFWLHNPSARSGWGPRVPTSKVCRFGSHFKTTWKWRTERGRCVSEMLLRLKGTRSFARTKADIHSSVQSSAHRSVSSPKGKNNYWLSTLCQEGVSCKSVQWRGDARATQMQ